MSSKLSRRSVLAGAGLAVGSTLLSLPGQATQSKPKGKRYAKNIIFCVSDGMSVGVPSMADQYMELSYGVRGIWYKTSMRSDIVKGLMDTRSLDSIVTDSSAAASAWGTGTLVLNGAVCTLPGLELTPLYDVLGGDGMLRGLVTTASATHATPSGFAASVTSRSAQPVIARQYLQRGVEFIMGGGLEFFSPELRDDKYDVFADYSKAGYSVAKTKQEMFAARGAKKFLGVYNKGQMPYSVDYRNNREISDRVPTLKEMSEFAIDHLSRSKNGFVLQIEGGRIDHGAHSNDFAALLYDQLAFEEAVKVALDFAERDGETLVIITTDHGNANPGITGSAAYGDGNGLMMLHGMKSSYEAMSADLRAAKTASDMQDLVLEKLSLKFKPEQAQLVCDAYAGTSFLKALGSYNYSSAGQVLAMAIGAHNGIGFTSGSHTSDWVEVMSYGPGADLFGGPVKIASFFEKMLSLRGIKFENPKMTLAEAKAAQSKLKEDESREVNEEIDLHWE